MGIRKTFLFKFIFFALCFFSITPETHALTCNLKVLWARVQNTSPHVDVLNKLDTLPMKQRNDFYELIQLLRQQDPPLRGLDVYEQVLLTSIQTGGSTRAILKTKLPINNAPDARGEPVIPWMQENFKKMKVCGPKTICYAVFQGVLPKDAEIFLAKAHKRLSQRLEKAFAQGFITYEDYIESAMDFSVLAEHSLDLPNSRSRQNFIDSFRELWDQGGPSGWSFGLKEPREYLEENLKGHFPILTLKSMSEEEVSVPGTLMTPLELISNFSYADNNLMLSLHYLRHDLSHGNNMMRSFLKNPEEPKNSWFPRLQKRRGDLSQLLREMKDWMKHRDFIFEHTKNYPELRKKLMSGIYSHRHESGESLSSTDFFEILYKIRFRQDAPSGADNLAQMFLQKFAILRKKPKFSFVEKERKILRLDHNVYDNLANIGYENFFLNRPLVANLIYNYDLRNILKSWSEWIHLAKTGSDPRIPPLLPEEIEALREWFSELGFLSK